MSRRRVSIVDVDSARKKLYDGSRNRVEGLKKELETQIIPDLIFASERTLAGWIAQGITMWHFGMALLNVGEESADWCGAILAPFGMYFVIYAFYLYYTRLKLIEANKPLPYDTSRLPIGIFTCFLVLSMGLNTAYNIANNASERMLVV